MADTMNINSRGWRAAIEVLGFATTVASSAALLALTLAWLIIEAMAAVGGH